MFISQWTPETLKKNTSDNNYMVFDVDSKTRNDEELINSTNYKFNIDTDILLSNSSTTRLAVRNKKKGINKIPRPQNAWIIYRRDKSVELRRDPARRRQKSKDLSKDIAQMWDKEPREVKELFEALSRMSEKKHVEIYGAYKYKPRRSKLNPNSLESSEKPYKKKPKRHTSEKVLYVETCGNYKTYKPRMIPKSLKSSNSNSQKSPELSNPLTELAVLALSTAEHTSSELKSLESKPSEYYRPNAMRIDPHKNFPYNIINVY